jgi:hypothetical protein
MLHRILKKQVMKVWSGLNSISIGFSDERENFLNRSVTMILCGAVHLPTIRDAGGWYTVVT